VSKGGGDFDSLRPDYPTCPGNRSVIGPISHEFVTVTPSPVTPLLMCQGDEGLTHLNW